MNYLFLFQVLLGAVMVLMGRRLFWLFVGAVGFVVGAALANQFLAGASQAVLIGIGLAAGVLSALLAIFFSQVAVAIAGFLAVGYLVARLITSLGFGTGFGYWLAFIVGGIIGVFLVNLLFDWALVILTTLAGTYLLIRALVDSGWLAAPVSNWLTLVLVIAFLALGVMIQSRGLKGKK